MARGRSNFGTRFKSPPKKRRGKGATDIAGAALAATAAASHEIARQSKKTAKRQGAVRNVSPEYAAAVQMAQETPVRVSVPPKPPKSPNIYRTAGILILVAGLLLLLLFWPLGLVVGAVGLYYAVSAPKIHATAVEQYEAALNANRGGGDL